MNDAVGYASASWWCVATVSSTASVVSPDLDITNINWALLAVQGSQGPQGPQGVQGPNKYKLGPGIILSNDSTSFSNSGYSPGITTSSTPSAFGFYAVTNDSFVFDPFYTFPAGSFYKIKMFVRVDTVVNDGLHCLLRSVDLSNSTESTISGLLDFQNLSQSCYVGESNAISTPGSPAQSRFIAYFAAYNGGNSAILRDVTLWFELI